MVASIVRQGARALAICWIASSTGAVFAGPPVPENCLREVDSTNTACLVVAANPGTVSPGSATQLTVTLNPVIKKATSRRITVQMTLTPSTGYSAPTVRSTSGVPDWNCAGSTASQVTCTTDSLANSSSRQFTVYVNAPNSGSLTNKTVFGWPGGEQGQSKTLSLTLAQSSSSANSGWIMPEGGSVSAGPSVVTANDPVAGTATFDAEPGRAPFLATAENITNGPTPPCLVSELGLGLVNPSPVFLCKDMPPFGVAGRWFKVSIGLTAALNTPIHLLRVNHTSTINPLQVSPTFPLAVGMHYTNFEPGVGYDPVNGTNVACGTGICIESSTKVGDAFFTSLRLETTFVAQAQSPYGRLLALLDFVVNPVTAGPIIKAPLTK